MACETDAIGSESAQGDVDSQRAGYSEDCDDHEGNHVFQRPSSEIFRGGGVVGRRALRVRRSVERSSFRRWVGMRGRAGVRGEEGVGWGSGLFRRNRAASARGRGGFAVMRGCGVVVVGDRDLSFDVGGCCHDTSKRGDEVENDSHCHCSGLLWWGKKRAERDRGRVHIPRRTGPCILVSE